eukprot:4496-Heterococcus_DN1.PRE.6
MQLKSKECTEQSLQVFGGPPSCIVRAASLSCTVPLSLAMEVITLAQGVLTLPLSERRRSSYDENAAGLRMAGPRASEANIADALDLAEFVDLPSLVVCRQIKELSKTDRMAFFGALFDVRPPESSFMHVGAHTQHSGCGWLHRQQGLAVQHQVSVREEYAVYDIIAALADQLSDFTPHCAAVGFCRKLFNAMCRANHASVMIMFEQQDSLLYCIEAKSHLTELYVEAQCAAQSPSDT